MLSPICRSKTQTLPCVSTSASAKCSGLPKIPDTSGRSRPRSSTLKLEKRCNSPQSNLGPTPLKTVLVHRRIAPNNTQRKRRGDYCIFNHVHQGTSSLFGHVPRFPPPFAASFADPSSSPAAHGLKLGMRRHRLVCVSTMRQTSALPDPALDSLWPQVHVNNNMLALVLCKPSLEKTNPRHNHDANDDCQYFITATY